MGKLNSDWKISGYIPVYSLHYTTALISILMNCFGKLVPLDIKDNIPASLDNHQFTFRTNRSTKDAISVFTHPKGNNTYITMLFVRFSSAFNTISPMILMRKHNTLGLSNTICSWTLGFFANWAQTERIGGPTSFTWVLNTFAHPGLCALSPLLFALCTHDCNPQQCEVFQTTLPSLGRFLTMKRVHIERQSLSNRTNYTA